MFLSMLKDDFPDVRLHIISKLEQVNKGKILAFSSESFLSLILVQLLALISSHSRFFLRLSS